MDNATDDELPVSVSWDKQLAGELTASGCRKGRMLLSINGGKTKITKKLDKINKNIDDRIPVIVYNESII